VPNNVARVPAQLMCNQDSLRPAHGGSEPPACKNISDQQTCLRSIISGHSNRIAGTKFRLEELDRVHRVPLCRNDCFSARMVPRSLQSRLPTKPSLATAALLLMVSCPTWALARGRISLISFSDTNRTEYV